MSLSKECVVCFGVSSGYKRPEYKRVEFEKGVARLRDNIERLGYDFMGWDGEWPKDWSSMRSCPYGFKFYAIKEAWERGYEYVLWADSSMTFSRAALERYFSKIKEDGYFFQGKKGKIKCSPYTAEYFGYPIEKIQGLQGVRGTYFGLSSESPVTMKFFNRIFELTKTGDTFRGTEELENFDLNAHWKDHRADQTVITLLANEMGLKIASPPGYGVKIDRSYVRGKYAIE